MKLNPNLANGNGKTALDIYIKQVDDSVLLPLGFLNTFTAHYNEMYQDQVHSMLSIATK